MTQGSLDKGQFQQKPKAVAKQSVTTVIVPAPKTSYLGKKK